MGTIQPKTAIRARVPNTYDKNRRPGSSGRRYFSDVEYVDNAPNPIDQPALNLAAQGRKDTQANTLSGKNSTNLARQSRPLNRMGLMALGESLEAKDFPYAALREYLAGVPSENFYRDGGITSAVPTPGAVPPKAVDREDIKTLAGLYRNAQARISAATDPRAKSTEQQVLNDLKMQMGDQLPYVMQYLDSTKGMMQPRTNGMAQGGLASIPSKGNGYYLGGPTDGMADQIPATIDNRQPAALSDGEFVIPADVVSHLGNGNSSAGATQLHGMMDKIRKARTGNIEQGRQIDANKFLA